MYIAKKSIVGHVITFDWADGSKDVIDIDQFSDAMLDRGLVHGFSAKLGDSYSGSKGDVAQAKLQFAEVFEALVDGDWNRAGGGIATGGIWVEAIAQAADSTIEEALTAWNAMTKEVKAVTKLTPSVKLAKAELELIRAKAKVDTSTAGTFTL